MDRREAIENAAYEAVSNPLTRYADVFERALEQAGYVIVPVEPTEGMIDRGVTSFSRSMRWGEIVSCIYRAMISAGKEGA